MGTLTGEELHDVADQEGLTGCVVENPPTIADWRGSAGVMRRWLKHFRG